MSDMEMYYGTFKKSDYDYEPGDTDDFYDLEKEHGCIFVKVKGQLYEVTKVGEVDPYGFSLVIPPLDEPRFLALWYNGGASIHEVVESIIERYTDE
jgi:hypothetical protein